MLTQVPIAEIVLMTSVALIAYVYVGYPVLVFLMSRLFARPVRQADVMPRVSLIITAYNEERDLEAKLDNSLGLSYPPEKLEIIVASDGSTDRTDDIVRSYANREVILCQQPERRGKTVAQRAAIRKASGSILVFSDATTTCAPDALQQIVRSFADSEVGCVAGQLVYSESSAIAAAQGCRSYWQYEKLLKQFESRVGSLIGVSGCFYAVRRSCYALLAHDMIDDFAIAFEMRMRNLRTVYEPAAVALEDTNRRSRDEFRMRVRVAEQTMNALHRYRKVLSLRRYGLFAWQVISHKLLRYAVPALSLVALASSTLALEVSGLCHFAFVVQVIFYGMAVMGWIGDRINLPLGPLAIPYYFVLVNTAAMVALLRFLCGETRVMWEPARLPRSPNAEASDSRSTRANVAVCGGQTRTEPETGNISGVRAGARSLL